VRPALFKPHKNGRSNGVPPSMRASELLHLQPHTGEDGRRFPPARKPHQAEFSATSPKVGSLQLPPTPTLNTAQTKFRCKEPQIRRTSAAHPKLARAPHPPPRARQEKERLRNHLGSRRPSLRLGPERTQSAPQAVNRGKLAPLGLRLFTRSSIKTCSPAPPWLSWVSW
jgi:hypothetical protein